MTIYTLSRWALIKYTDDTRMEEKLKETLKKDNKKPQVEPQMRDPSS